VFSIFGNKQYCVSVFSPDIFICQHPDWTSKVLRSTSRCAHINLCWFNHPRLNRNSWYVDIPEHYFKPDNQLEISGSIVRLSAHDEVCKIEPAGWPGGV